jgi:hypothetical protein
MSMTEHDLHHDHDHRERTVQITIDGERITAPSHEQTARQLLALVGKNATEDYLVLIKGKRERESFKDHPDTEIHLHHDMKFITVSLGPTPVS